MESAHLEQLLADLQSEGASPGRAGARLCTACVQVLDVDGAGIMLVDDQEHLSAFGVSDDLVGRLEELQYTLGEGPGVDAHATKRLVWEPDLRAGSGSRWPAFGPVAEDEDVGAAFAMPLRVGAIGLGALDLYCRRPGPLGTHQLTDAMTLADVAVAMLLALQSGAAFGTGAGDIDIPGGLRAHVHQASGMVSEQLDAAHRGQRWCACKRLRTLRGDLSTTSARDIINRRVQIDEMLG